MLKINSYVEWIYKRNFKKAIILLILLFYIIKILYRL